jgi:hypothetical protein
MIRPLVLFGALALVAVAAVAQQTNRDLLLAPSGKLFVIESGSNMAFETSFESSFLLRLTVQNGEEIVTDFVPGSLLGGFHTDASLAYDESNDQLFVLWQYWPNRMSSELLFCSYKDGQWSEVHRFNQSRYTLRSNLRTAVTRFVESTVEGETVRRPGLTIHATWWEETGYGEEAHYAMIAIDKGEVQEITHQALDETVADQMNPEPFELPADFPGDLFRSPAIFPNTSGTSVDIIFANSDTNRFGRVNVRPIAGDGVIRVPDFGFRGEMPPPTRGYIQATGKIEVASTGSGSSMALFTTGEKAVSYQMYRDGEWSDARSLALSAILSREAAVEALRKLVASE